MGEKPIRTLFVRGLARFSRIGTLVADGDLKI
jgi:hypothetical protein